MNKKSNDILLKNVHLLSRLTEQEVRMMPAVEAPLPSVEHVERIVRLVKSIIFPDYFNKRQSDESIRAYYIGNYMVELQRLLIKQIAHGLQFCEDCTDLHNRETVYACAERLPHGCGSYKGEHNEHFFHDYMVLFWFSRSILRNLRSIFRA